MRKIFAYLLPLILISCGKPKPEGLILKIQYQPEKTYSISTIRGTETVITYSGEEVAMQKLMSKNINNPTISKVKTKSTTELVTSKKITSLSFPVSLIYKETLSLDGKNEIPEGTEIHGEIISENLPNFHTVSAETLDDHQKMQLLQTVRSTFEQLNFPEKRIKIGDEFSIDRTTFLPMERSEIETIITTTYKLISIEKEVATFELTQTYRMTPEFMDNTFTGNGQGKGEMYFDINKSIISGYTMNTEINMNKKFSYFEFNLKTKNEFSQSTNLVTK